jgi:1,4-dihydroxy-2-naphthoate polyprenyltransferase
MMLTNTPTVKAYHWILAARPKTLTQSLVPIFLGVWLAKGSHEINWPIALFTALGALLIQVGTNLINDALDCKKGADTDERLGPQRAAQQGWFTMQQILIGGVVCFALAALCAIPLIIHGGPLLLAMAAICIAFSYLYTGGPYPLAYYGLGDPFVLLFYGIAAVSFTYYLQTGAFALTALIAGTQIGLLSTVLIAINNLRDIKGDLKACKYTLAARYGKSFARWEVTLLISSAYFLGLFWLLNGQWTAAVCPLATLPRAIKLINNIWRYDPGTVYNKFLADAALLHLSFGVLLAIGYNL